MSSSEFQNNDIKNRWAFREFVSGKALSIGVWSIILNMVLGIGLLVSLYFKPPARFFAVTENLEILEIIGTNKPPINETGIRQWALRAVLAATNLSFSHYRDQLSKAEVYFSKPSWKSYLTVLETSGNISLIKQQRVNLTTTANGSPIIITEGIVEGGQQWAIEIPLIMTYEGSATRNSKNAIARVVVGEVDKYERPEGLAILQLIVEDR